MFSGEGVNWRVRSNGCDYISMMAEGLLACAFMPLSFKCQRFKGQSNLINAVWPWGRLSGDTAGTC